MSVAQYTPANKVRVLQLMTMTSNFLLVSFNKPLLCIRHILIVLLACFTSLVLYSDFAMSAPLLKEPTFLRVSTEQGLSQDSVNALVVDSEGFLWVATDDGLNRFDGYQVKSISGSNNEFQNIPIQSLFQDSKGYLWVGTDVQGIFQLNLETGQSIKIAALPNVVDPNFLQLSSQILEDKQGNIWIVLEQTLLKYRYEDHAISTVLQLDDENLADNHYFRWALVEDSTIFLATSNSVIAFDTESGKRSPIDYLQAEIPNADKLDSKFLFVDNQRLWIGTVEGLYSLPLQQTLDYVQGKNSLPASVTHIKNRNIWRFVKAQDDLFYLATDQGLFSYDQKNSQLQHLFLPTDNREYLASDVLKEIIVDDKQNIWLGSESDGALYWSPKTTLFQHIFNAKGGRINKILSSNDVKSIYNDGNDNLWIGTNNGLNLYNLNEGESQRYLESSEDKAQRDFSYIAKIGADTDNNLWLLAGSAIVHFDTKTKSIMPLYLKNPQDQRLLNNEVYGMKVLPDGDILFFNDIGLYRYLVTRGEIVELETSSYEINITKANALLAPLNNKPNTTLFSVIGQLWQIDNDTQQLTLLHSLLGGEHRSEISADSAVVDRNGVLWIAYPGLGLVGLDSETKAQKYFYNKDNLLATNSIYGLQLDDMGNIWMSSHSGILSFNPLTQHIKKFGVAQGLKNLEFNQYTNLRLPDGRMVYGSPKGVTMFNPAQFSELSKNQNPVRITSVELSSELLAMPIKDLSGQHFKLSHEDVGLKIHFSNLEFENQNSIRYGYTLKGASEVEFTETRVPEVMFPKLGPGRYRFSVVAFDSLTGAKSKESVITFDVAHAPWASPLAFFWYATICGLFIALLIWRKYKNNLILKMAHQEVLESKNKLTLALSASNSGIWEFQVFEKLFYAPRLRGELQHSFLADGVSFQQNLAFIHDQDRVYYEKQWRAFLNGDDAELDVTFRMRGANDNWIWYRDMGSAVQTDVNGKPSLVTGTYTNITANLVDQENLRLFGEAFKHTHSWVLIYDHKQQPIAANIAFRKTFNISEKADLGTAINKIAKIQKKGTIQFWAKLQNLKVNAHWKGEDKITLLDGSVCDVLANIHAIESVRDNQSIEYYIVILADISEQKIAEEKLRRLANFDSLTGLPNRALLLDRVDRGLEHANRHHKSMTLFFIDLDRFKQVNDSLGHKAGDELLRVISKRLTGKLRKEDTVARLGGDEFVIMIEDVQSAEAISALVNEISTVIDLPISLSNQTVSVSSSIGIAMYPGDGESAEELLKNADIAMYHAKEQGRSNFQFFTKEMDAIVKERLVLENKLKSAHQRKKFLNYYQPIININSGEIEGFEILMRWPTKNGMVPPDKFIPISEELGLIEPMTLDAFKRAMPVLKFLRGKGFDGYLSFNLSARHFESQTSIERIMILLEQNDIPVEAIRFEITESALMRDYEKALTYMLQIKQKGFLIALDDFGTGYSSLKYLKEFPIKVIKVDKSFVDDIGKNKNNESIILTTLRMAEQLNMSCVAEGIETMQQVEFFKLHQCVHLQGYYFSKPVPAEALAQLLDMAWPH